MLVLSRKIDETIIIGDNIKVQVLKIKGNTIRIGIEAPSDVKILRGELAPFGIEKEADADEEKDAKPESASRTFPVIGDMIEFDIDVEDLNGLPNPFAIAQVG